MTPRKKKMGLAQIKLYVDITLLIGFILVNIPQSTGIPFHEWFSLVFIVPLITHILIDWKWVVSVTKRMLGRLPGEVRANHIIDLLIFILMVLALFTGFIVSEAALPALGIDIVIDQFWVGMHHLTANLIIVFIGIHLAMHWKWIKTNVSKYLFNGKDRSEQIPVQGGD